VTWDGRTRGWGRARSSANRERTQRRHHDERQRAEADERRMAAERGGCTHDEPADCAPADDGLPAT